VYSYYKSVGLGLSVARCSHKAVIGERREVVVMRSGSPDAEADGVGVGVGE
jgi:hypothetical protein